MLFLDLSLKWLRKSSKVIFDAVTDGTNRLRYLAGADAVELLNSRKELDDDTFIGGLKKQLQLS